MRHYSDQLKKGLIPVQRQTSYIHDIPYIQSYIRSCTVHSYILLYIQIKEGLHVTLTDLFQQGLRQTAMVPRDIDRRWPWQPVR